MTHTGHIQRESFNLAYESWGEGEALVFVHGFGTDREVMRGLARAVGEGERCYRVVLLDLRGHGASGAPGDLAGLSGGKADDTADDTADDKADDNADDEAAYGYPVQCQDLLALLDALQIDRAHWIGHSMGGQLALMAALRAPERTRSLVAIAAGPCRAIVEEREQRAWGRAAERFAAMSGAELSAALDAAAPRVAIAAAGSGGEDPAQLYGRSRGAELARIVRGAFLAMRDNADACCELEKPSLVMAGDRDAQWLDPARRLADLLPRAELQVVPNAGHLVHLEQPDTVAERIRSFLAAH